MGWNWLFELLSGRELARFFGNGFENAQVTSL
jgi:hypothetical protein